MKIFLSFKRKIVSLFSREFFKLFGHRKELKILFDRLDIHKSKISLITQAILELEDRIGREDGTTLDNVIFGLSKKVDIIQEALLYQQKAIEQIDKELRTYSTGGIKIRSNKDIH